MNKIDTREDLPGAVEFRGRHGDIIWIHPSAVVMIGEEMYDEVVTPNRAVIYFRTGFQWLVRGELDEVKERLGW